MSLSFFSDQCVPAEISDALREDGHAITLLREVLPIRSPDSAVIANPETIPSLMDRLAGFLSANPDQTFYHGKLFIVEPHRIRIRQ